MNVKLKKYTIQIRSERVTGRERTKWQLTAIVKIKDESRQSGRGGTRDQNTNGKIRHVIFW